RTLRSSSRSAPSTGSSCGADRKQVARTRLRLTPPCRLPRGGVLLGIDEDLGQLVPREPFPADADRRRGGRHQKARQARTPATICVSHLCVTLKCPLERWRGGACRNHGPSWHTRTGGRLTPSEAAC